MDEDDFKNFIIDFHEKSSKNMIRNFGSEDGVEDLEKFKELQKKFRDMKCSKTMKTNFEKQLSVRFPIINEILNTEEFINSDKKELITDIIISEYQKNDLHQFKAGEKVFEELVERLTTLYEKSINIPKSRLRYYIKVFVAWVINECGIFNEEISA